MFLVSLFSYSVSNLKKPACASKQDVLELCDFTVTGPVIYGSALGG